MVDGKTAARRLSGVTNRPLLKAANPIDKIEEILAGRLPVYLAAADLVVDTADLDVNQVVDKILEGLAQ
jgi:shikimate kinase